jgi:hypothetical protein
LSLLNTSSVVSQRPPCFSAPVTLATTSSTAEAIARYVCRGGYSTCGYSASKRASACVREKGGAPL